MLLGPTCSTLIAIVGADRSLARNTIIPRKADTSSCFAVTRSFVGTFFPRLQIVGINNRPNPCKIFGASAQRAVRTSPLGFTVKASEAFAIAIHFTGTMSRATIFTKTTLTMSLFIPSNLSPRVCTVRGGSSGASGRLATGTARRLG